MHTLLVMIASKGGIDVTTRQDAWTKDEDLLLAETVIRYIREGKTQMKAFQSVGEKLNRTAQACGFRWNANLRKHYDQAIELAKKDRKQLGRQRLQTFKEEIPKQEIERFDDLIAQLKRLKEEYGEFEQPDKVEKLQEQLEAYHTCLSQIHNLTQPFVNGYKTD